MLLLKTKLKWFSVKFRKGMKKSDLACSGIIKDIDEICVRILLFLFCFRAKDLEKIDMDFFRSCVNEYIEDDAFLSVLKYLQEKNVLDYKYEKTEVTEHKGANMDKIVNIIGDISDNINSMTDGEYKEAVTEEEQLEFEKIYRVGGGENHTCFPKVIQEKSSDFPQIIGNTHEETVKFEKLEISEISKEDIFFDADIEINTDLSDEKISSDKIDSQVTLDIVCDELEKNDDFRNLYSEVQIKLKAIINPYELEILYNLYNNVERELLLKIAESCGESAENPQTVVNYFEKTVLQLSDGGIKTLEQYIKHLENARKASEYEMKIKKIFGISDKKLNAKERQYIRTWALEYNFPDEMIIEGYTKALDKGKATIPYINAIYLGWYEKGFKSVDDVRGEFINPGSNCGVVKQKSQSDFDSDLFFEKLVRKSMKF